MLVKSETTGKTYDDDKVLFFNNAKQSASYVLWGAELLDIIPTHDRRFVFVFSKDDHREYRDKWNNFE